MRKTSEAPKEQRRHFTRFLSLAAAAVFLVGGTLLTRDQLPADRALRPDGGNQRRRIQRRHKRLYARMRCT